MGLASRRAAAILAVAGDAGTLTGVSRLRVAVRDLRRTKTVLVRAGKSYLAKAPR